MNGAVSKACCQTPSCRQSGAAFRPGRQDGLVGNRVAVLRRHLVRAAGRLRPVRSRNRVRRDRSRRPVHRLCQHEWRRARPGAGMEQSVRRQRSMSTAPASAAIGPASARAAGIWTASSWQPSSAATQPRRATSASTLMAPASPHRWKAAIPLHWRKAGRLSRRRNWSGNICRLTIASDRFSSVSFDPDDSVTGRLGVRLQGETVLNGMALQPYLKANIWHDFGATSACQFRHHPTSRPRADRPRSNSAVASLPR